MSELSTQYRERLARMAGGEMKSSSGTAVVTRASRPLPRADMTSRSDRKALECKQMRHEMRFTSVSTRADAAAFQNDLAQRYNLQGVIRPSQKKMNRSRHVMQSSEREHGQGRHVGDGMVHMISASSRICESCLSSNSNNSSVCEECGYFMAGSQQAPLTMAQSRGLVPIPAPVGEALKDYEWECIERGLASRQDAYCPICMEGFNKGFEVLLSCSHMYHRSCLQSFEKYMKSSERSCPICRTTNYQKKITHVGTKAFEIVCAVTIQKNWRGYRCRALYYNELKQFYKNGGVSLPICRKKFFEKELSSHTNRLAKEGEYMENEVNTLFSSMDKVMQDNRELDLAFELMMMERHNFEGVSGFGSIYGMSNLVDADYEAHEKCDGEVTRSEWSEILNNCLKRGDNNAECAICMSDIDKNRNRRVVLLSCSHMFHQQCIMMLEDFVKTSEDFPLCPMCRCPFERKLLSRDLKSFDDIRIR